VRHASDNPLRLDAERYFAMAECGVLSPDERVELLEGMVVAMPPQSPQHATAVQFVANFLQRTLGADIAVRVQMPFLAGGRSVPEPDIAVVPGRLVDYRTRHPASALLVVEVADWSLSQDRLTKAAIYAAAGVPDYWVIDLRGGLVVCFASPRRRAMRYVSRSECRGSQQLPLASFPGARIEAGELFP